VNGCRRFPVVPSQMELLRRQWPPCSLYHRDDNPSWPPKRPASTRLRRPTKRRVLRRIPATRLLRPAAARHWHLTRRACDRMTKVIKTTQWIIQRGRMRRRNRNRLAASRTFQPPSRQLVLGGKTLSTLAGHGDGHFRISWNFIRPVRPFLRSCLLTRRILVAIH